MHVVGVGGRSCVGVPASCRVVCPPDFAVPDDVHDAEAAGFGVSVSGGVGGQHPSDSLVGAFAVGGGVGVEGPVPGAAFLVFGRSADGAGSDDSEVSAAELAEEHGSECECAWFGYGVAFGLRSVSGEVLDGGCGDGDGGEHREGEQQGQGEQGSFLQVSQSGPKVGEGVRVWHGRGIFSVGEGFGSSP